MAVLAASETAAAERREDPEITWTEDPCEAAEEIDWEFTLDRTCENTGLGVALFATPHSLAVQAIVDGLISDWNRKNPDQEVRRGDVITAVNGKGGDGKVAFELLRCEPIVRLHFKRVPRFEISVAVDSRTMLGLDFGDESMEVRSVVEGGCIDSYNARCKPGYQVIPGDTIVAVNDKVDVALMLNELHVAGKHKVVIERH